MNTELRAGSLSFLESIVMGVAGSAPGYTIAVTTAVLLGTAGTLSPGALLIFAVPMLGIAVAYKALNRRHVHAGAAYQWTTVDFGKFLGFFSGWALLVASLVFMVTGSLPLATSTLDFVDPALTDHVVLTAAVASLWFLAMAAVLIMGIQITSSVQMVMTTVELIVLTLVAGVAFAHAAKFGAVNPFRWSWFGLGYSPAGFAASALVVVFFYWGWDVTANLAEETANAEDNAGNGGFVSIFVTIAYYVAFIFAALFLFSIKDAQGFNANIIYNIAVGAGLGRQRGIARVRGRDPFQYRDAGDDDAAILAHAVRDGTRRRDADTTWGGGCAHADARSRHARPDRHGAAALVGFEPDAHDQFHHRGFGAGRGRACRLLLWARGAGGGVGVPGFAD